VLLIGFNDLLTTHPEVAKGALGWDPSNVGYSSNEKVAWKCENEVHIFLNSRYDSLALGAFTVPYVDISDVRVINRSSPEGAIIAVVLGISFLTLLAWVGISSLFEEFHLGK
jgi:hypothetical protein